MRTSVCPLSVRALVLSATPLLATLATAYAGLAVAQPPPPAGSISLNDYLPELQRLRQAGDWAGLERASRQALSALSDRKGPNSEDVATASEWLATALESEGRYTEAEPLYQRALGIEEKTLGSNDPHVAATLHSLALLYQGHGQYDKAEPLFQRALAVAEKAFGPNDARTATVLHNLASLYKAQGQYAKAEPLYQRALSIYEKSVGSNHPYFAGSLSRLAELYLFQGQYAKAEPLYQRALGIKEKALGPNDPSVAETLNGLAVLYVREGQYTKAEPLLQRALAIRERSVGPNDLNVAESLGNLGELYRQQGQYAKAEPLYQRALDIHAKALGPDAPDVGLSLNNLATVYSAQGQYAKAEPLLERALGISQKSLGPSHPRVAAGFNNLAALYREQGQYARAEPLYERALAIYEKALGPYHPDVAQNLNSLAALYADEGQYARAEPLFQRAFAIWVKAFGRNHPDVATSLNNLAGLCLAQGEYARAEPLIQQALTIQENVLGPGHPDVATTLDNLAKVYRMRGRYPEAEALYQRALAIKEKVLGPDHPAMATTLDNLAWLYDERGQYAKGETLAQRALGIAEKTFGPAHPATTTARETLAHGDLLQAKFDQATANFRLACTARSSLVHSGNRTGEATQAVQTSAGSCSTFHALSLWSWAAQGGGAASADRPDALKREAFETSQRAINSAAGTALARSAALTAANSARVGPEARDYETTLLERERLEKEEEQQEFAKAAGTTRRQSAEKLQALARTHDEVVSEIKRLEGVLQSKAPLYWDYRSPAPVSVATLQATDGRDSSLLHRNEALIVFLVPPGKDRGLVFAVSKEKVAWARIGATGTELQAAVIKLRTEIDPEGYALRDFRGMEVSGVSPAAVPEASDSPSSAGETLSTSTATTRTAFDRHLAYEIYRVLLGDASIQEVVQDKAVLLFVPSGPLTALPPGLLVTAVPSGGTERDIDPAALRATAWLLRSKAVAVLPAVSSLRTLRQILPTERVGRSDPLLAFADPVFTPPGGGLPSRRAVGIPRAFQTYFRNGIPLAEAMGSLPALPGTRIEAEALRRALGAQPSSLLLGRDASKAELMARNADGRLAQVRVLEFATHGLVAGDISDVGEPGLVLAAGSKPEDALLLASEASTLRLKADWVLLSACNTASPDAPEAQGLSGLSRAFFYAGARSLLVSHWLVRDDVAPLLIPAVLQAERANPHLSRAEALREASLAVLDDPHLNAAGPAAWAAFTLIGEAGRD